MTPRQQQIVKNVDKYRQDILDAERWIWQHPEVGYTEWQTNAYLLEKFRSYGYEPVEAGEDPDPAWPSWANWMRWTSRITRNP